MSDIISVGSLVKRYHKATTNAVDDISFSVAQGQLFSLLGPNGAGKTTTLSILTTTLSKTSGEVKIAGFDLEKQSSQVRRNIGVIFQNPSLDDNLTAEENVRFHAILYGLYPFRPTFSSMPQDYKDRVNQLAEILAIQKDIFKPIKTFSGGMKRKLEVVRGLMHRPKILFLDEPTTGLDPLSRRNLWDYLTQMRKQEKVTIFLTTHYLDEAEDADNICVINQGKIIAHGTPYELKQQLVQDYLVLDSRNRKSLVKELQSLKLKFTQDYPLKVTLDHLTAQDVIGKLKTKLSVLTIHTPSLEDAYLEIVRSHEES